VLISGINRKWKKIEKSGPCDMLSGQAFTERGAK
jgi:hypothetical protein